MTQSIKRLPAVFMAVLLAAMLALAMGLSLQQVHAASEISDASLQTANGSENVYTDGDIVINVVEENGVDLYSEGWKFEELYVYLYDYSTNKETDLPTSCYSVDGLSVKVHGESLKQYAYYDEEWDEMTYPYLCLDGSIVSADESEQVDLGESEFILYDPFLDCHYDADSMDLMPGESDFVDRHFTATEYCNASPDGESEVNCTVTDVKIVGGAAEGVIELSEIETGWYIDAIAAGKAQLEVTYDGSSIENKYYIDVNVTHETLGVYVESKSGYDRALPGKSLTLIADAHHYVMDEKGEISEGKIKSYKWSLNPGSGDYATLTKNKKKPSQATLKFKSKNKKNEVVVWCEVTAKSQDGKTLEARTYEFFYRDTDFYQISPAKAPTGLDIGKTAMVNPTLRHYTVKKPKGVVVNDVYYEWEFINEDEEDCFDISPASGSGSFMLTRQNGIPVAVQLNAYDPAAMEEDTSAFYDDQTYYFDDARLDLSNCYAVAEGDLDGTHAYGVEGTDGTLDPEDMDIKVYDYDTDTLIPDNMYEIEFAPLNDDSEDELTPVDPPLTIDDPDKSYTEYAVYAVGDDIMSVSQSDYADIVVQDENSLADYGATFDFGNRTLNDVEASKDGVNPNGIYSICYGTMQEPDVSSPAGISLTEGTDYTLTYYKVSESGESYDKLDAMPTELGFYYAQVEGKGSYYGTSFLQTFSIDPIGTQITKLAKAKKAFTVKWNKQAEMMSGQNITGYIIEYTTNEKAFEEDYDAVKKKKVKGFNKTSLKIKKLKAKKNYYVRICTYA
ncbi:MAG: hypothetical protein Q4A65_07700 [Bacillota bacterium]|nr:hypothetical protein [Bacillota bacterium]